MSARGVFVAGTDTGVGKTRTTLALLRALRQRGVRATGMKPIATGRGAPPQHVNEDVALIRAASDLAQGEDINPYCFDWPVSPHLAARRAGVTIDLAHIAAAYARLAGGCAAVIVEGTGGWFAPIGERQTMADVAMTLQLPIVLVVGLRLGCLSHALLTTHAIVSSGVPLLGWLGSVLDPGMPALAENIATLTERLPGPCLGLLPYASDLRAHVLQFNGTVLMSYLLADGS